MKNKQHGQGYLCKYELRHHNIPHQNNKFSMWDYYSSIGHAKKKGSRLLILKNITITEGSKDKK